MRTAPAGPIDVSVTIRPDMPIYEGDPSVQLSLARALDRGDLANVSRLELGAHTGTHVDAPRHFLAAGAGVRRTERRVVRRPLRRGRRHGGRRRDRRGGHRRPRARGRHRARPAEDPELAALGPRFVSPEFVRLDGGGAAALIERGVRLVGIDCLSVGDPDAHRALLGRGVGVLEGLDLRSVEPGAYFLVCLPLKIAGCDGAPARALLWPLTRTPCR